MAKAKSFADQVVFRRAITRRDLIREYIRDVGSDYIAENLEKVLLEWYRIGHIAGGGNHK